MTVSVVSVQGCRQEVMEEPKVGEMMAHSAGVRADLQEGQLHRVWMSRCSEHLD